MCPPDNDNPWLISETDLAAGTGPSYETIYAQANGYRCLRATSPFLPPFLPGSFLAGVYDQAEAPVTELVNGPDPLRLTVYLDGEAVERGKLGSGAYSRTLDLQSGVMESSLRYQAATKAVLECTMERFVSQAHRHRWAERWTFRAVNFSRRILITTAIDGRTLSNARHPLEATRHFTVTEQRALGDDRSLPCGLLLAARTRDLGIEIAEAHGLTGPASLQLVKVRSLSDRMEAVWSLDLEEGQTTVVHRLGATTSSRDRDFPGCGEGTPLTSVRAERELQAFVKSGYNEEVRLHVAAWARLWDQIDIRIEGDVRAQRALRYNLYQLTSSAPADDRVSIGAKGLHGEGYKGHVFWDTETFMFPFFLFTQPETARTLLRYRYNTLAGARKNAASGGHRGARYAWESADTGVETTPRWGVDYAGNQVRIWTGDQEVHINADITYALLRYLQVTGDEAFLASAGLEMLFGIAEFWASFVTWNAIKNAYEILQVIGPDEFHEHIDNNAYTNYLVRWALRKSADLADLWRSKNPTGLDAEAAARWRHVADRLHVPVDLGSTLIEQFDGYFQLKEYPITEWDDHGMPKWPQGVDVAKLNETTLLKQPDVVMLFALLGEEFSLETKRANYEFYEARTMHKSSLSPSMYAMVGLSIGRTDHAYDYFLKAAETDLVDNQGNNVHGIHTANMGGVWQTAVFGFGGLSVDREDRPNLNPWLPPHWKRFQYRFVWRGTSVKVEVSHDRLLVTPDGNLDVVVRGRLLHCSAGLTTIV